MAKYRCDRGHEFDAVTTFNGTATNSPGGKPVVYTYCFDCQAEEAQGKWPLHDLQPAEPVAAAREGEHVVKAKK